MRATSAQKKKILHITPHFGGGVGNVIIDWIKADTFNNHTVFCLDYLNNRVKEEISLNSLSIKQIPYTDPIVYDWDDYDIVLIHWWDNQLVHNLLKLVDMPPCRLIFWCHKNYEIPNWALNYPDLFIGTAPCQHLKDYIWSVRNMELFDSAYWYGSSDNIFRVGYVGSQKKISQNYLASVAMLPDVEFVFIGIEETRIMNSFMNIRLIENITDDNELAKHYKSFSVFGYPLSKDHYGTCEQVLGEAMRSHCVPVVMNNECESYIVRNGVNGFVANTIEDYVRFIKILRDYPDIRRNMGYKARVESFIRYDHLKMINQWEDVFSKLMKQKKRAHK